MVNESELPSKLRHLEDSNQVNWNQVNKLVRNLRQRIFRASRLSDFRKLHLM